MDNSSFNINITPCNARALVFVYLLVNHWHNPLADGIAPLLQAYILGVSNGDVNFGRFAAVGCVSTAFHSGMPLGEVKKIMLSYKETMDDFNQASVLSMMRPLLQVVQNL